MTITITTQEAPLVEQTTLPKLIVRGKSNEALMEAYVNAYVVGSQKEPLTNGKAGTCQGRSTNEPVYNWPARVKSTTRTIRKNQLAGKRQSSVSRQESNAGGL